MASCQCRCVCLIVIPAAATNTPPIFPLSSILDLRGSTGRRRRFSGISSTSPSFSFRGRQRQCLLFNRNSESTCTTSGPFHRCNSQLGGDLAPATSAAYGVLLLVGGLFAYTRTGSKGSLLGGLTGGSLMAAAYFLMQASEMKEIGDALAFGSTFLFASVFGIRLAAIYCTDSVYFCTNPFSFLLFFLYLFLSFHSFITSIPISIITLFLYLFLFITFCTSLTDSLTTK